MPNTTTPQSLLNLGFDASFYLNENLSINTKLGRIIAEFKEAYRVKTLTGEYLAKVTGKHIFLSNKKEDYPAVGDWVKINILNEKNAIINEILPRKTILKRQSIKQQDTQLIAANVDYAFIVESADNNYNLNRFERYLILAEEGKIQPVLVLNKIDLLPPFEIALLTEEIETRFPLLKIITTSSLSEEGIADLKEFIQKGKTYIFLGSSGVGKSSIINQLIGTNSIKTTEISIATGKGKHTTTSREMYFLEDNGILIDNPGTREVGIADSESGLNIVFDEITQLSKNCRFANCTHQNEPGCAIIEALENNQLDTEKYTNYLKLKKETEFYQMSAFEKREKERKFGKLVHKIKKNLP